MPVASRSASNSATVSGYEGLNLKKMSLGVLMPVASRGACNSATVSNDEGWMLKKMCADV